MVAASSWLLLAALLPTASSFTTNQQAMRDAAHITANAGDSIVFNCGVQVRPMTYVLVIILSCSEYNFILLGQAVTWVRSFVNNFLRDPFAWLGGREAAEQLSLVARKLSPCTFLATRL